MADLTVTVTENVILNNERRGSTNTVTIADILNTFERMVVCTHSQTTTIATFATAPYTSAGAIDVDDVRYIRVTNLDTQGTIELGVVTTASNYQVRMTPGTSHILARANESALGEEDTSPSFGTMENLASLQVRPDGTSYNPRVEIFVGVAE